jgi:hypothetical protein
VRRRATAPRTRKSRPSRSTATTVAAVLRDLTTGDKADFQRLLDALAGGRAGGTLGRPMVGGSVSGAYDAATAKSKQP